jgi:uncharacterized protein YprB with RNaseH-like and TPR domain
MLSRFFKKQKTEENKSIAKLSYIVNNNSKSPILDIELQDYDDQSIEALCNIIDILASDKFIVETVEIIKNALVNDGKEDYLLKVFSGLSKNTKSKMLNSYREKEYDEPCIRPSDAFLGK